MIDADPLARFAEYRGVGRNTTYGLGRVRILRPNERWEPGTVISAWETESARAGSATTPA